MALLQGVVARWPQSTPAKTAQAKLQEILNDPARLQLIADQGGSEERKFLVEQSKALERFGKIKEAIQSWQYLAQKHPNTPEGEMAVMEAKRLQEKK